MIKNSFSFSKKVYWFCDKIIKNFFSGSSYDNFEKAMSFSGESISDCKVSSIFRYKLNDKNVYVKQYRKSMGVLSWLGLSRCHLEARNQLFFNENSIPSAKLLAFGEERIGLKTFRGVLITEGVENSYSLLQIVQKFPEQFKNSDWCKNIADQVVEITKKMHSSNFCHNDYHFRNILVKDFDTNPKVFLIDCPKGMFMRFPFANNRKEKDLACLYKKCARFGISPKIMLRFYKKYEDIAKLSNADKQRITRVSKRYSK